VAIDEQALRRLARSSGLTPADVRRYLELEAIDVRRERSGLALVVTLRRVRRLRRDLGLSLDAAAIVVRLVERIEELQETRRRPLIARIVEDATPEGWV
jgi:hypothetical protein